MSSARVVVNLGAPRYHHLVSPAARRTSSAPRMPSKEWSTLAPEVYVSDVLVLIVTPFDFSSNCSSVH